MATKLKEAIKNFPVVSISGSRQSGKTTLVRMVFPDHQYVSLEDPEEREFALMDPKGFLARFKSQPVILDEIQRAPKLLSYIQTIVDNTNQEGEFILTGSQQIHFYFRDYSLEYMIKICQPMIGWAAITKHMLNVMSAIFLILVI